MILHRHAMILLWYFRAYGIKSFVIGKASFIPSALSAKQGIAGKELDRILTINNEQSLGE